MKRAILFGWFVLLYSVALFAAPDFPVLSGRVVDQAQLIEPTDESLLTQKLQNLEENTSVQFVVVTVNNLQGYDVADYALQLGRYWGIGQKENDNGIILLVAKEDRKMRIEVGYGLEGVVTDAYSSYVIRNMLVPAFSRGEYSTGIMLASNKLIAKIKQDPGANIPKEYSDDGSLAIFMLLPILILLNSFIRSIFGEKAQYIAAPASSAVAWLVTNDLFLTIMVGVFVFFVAFNSMLQPSRRSYRDGYGGFGGGFGGGFSGGGGSFGGGGASGGW